MNPAERHLQLCLHYFQNWADENGFEFSKKNPKTVCVHFVPNDSCLYLDGNQVLSFIFDDNISFIMHIK